MKYFVWIAVGLVIAFLEHTFLRAMMPEHMLEFGILAVIGYALATLDYKQVTYLGFILGIIEGLFSLAPLSLFAISYIAVGNTLVFIGRNVTTHRRSVTALLGACGALAYIMVNGILLYIFFELNMSDVGAGLRAESWGPYLVVSAGGALAGYLGRMIAAPLTHSESTSNF